MSYDKNLEAIRREVLNQMPYLEAPESVWIQRDKQYLIIDQMGLDHMKNSIKAVKRDIKSLKQRSEPIKIEFLELAEEKLKELENEYKRKVQI